MTPRLQYWGGKKVTTWSNNPSILLSDAYAYKDNVACGPLVRGNFKDPNNWWYEVYHTKYYRTLVGGKVIWAYPSIPGRALYYTTITGCGVSSTGYPARGLWDERNAVYNAALSRLNEKVRGGLDLGVTLAEIGQTARMLKSLNHVTKLAHIAKRSWRTRTPIGGLRDVANGWLAWQYGWRQALQDVFGILDESQRVVINKLEHFTASASHRRTGITQRIKVPISDIPETPFDRVFNEFTKCKFGISLEIPNQDLARWTSLNPVSLGWELIPYSFVVDWFIDVGGYLRNMETALLYGTRFKNGYSSELYHYDCIDTCRHYEISAAKNNTDHDTIVSKVSGTMYDSRFYRTRLSSYPFPRTPTFSVDLGGSRILSAASLLYQIFSGKPGKQPPSIGGGPSGSVSSRK